MTIYVSSRQRGNVFIAQVYTNDQLRQSKGQDVKFKRLIRFWWSPGDTYICVELLNNSPIIIVLGTILGSLGFFLILLYMVIACNTFKSCLLYSWILFTWMSKIEAGLILIFVCSSRYWASFNLFWALIWKRNGNLAF